MTISNNLLIKHFSEIIHFVSKIGFSPNSIFWTFKGLSKRYFTESYIEAIMFLIKFIKATIENEMRT